MNKVEKYYTPSIEEFSVGFDYEVHTCFDGSGNYKWIKQTFHESTFELLIDTDDGGERGFSAGLIHPVKLRVKLLDRQDIEECGFTHEKDNQYYAFSSTENDGELNLILYFNEDEVIINNCQGSYEFRCFSGTIKNKHELQRVLKMIGYETTRN